MTIEYNFKCDLWSHVLHIKTPICTRIPIPKGRLTVLTNYPSVTKDKALEETALTLFQPVVYGCFQLFGVEIHLPVTMLSKAKSQK